jgi:hypothetical protein
MGLSHNAAGIATVAFTPFVAGRYGWRAVPTILGRTFALYHRSSTLYQIHLHIRRLHF